MIPITISPSLIALLKREEGFTPVPKIDNGGWEIGYGHWMIKRMIEHMTEEEACWTLVDDIVSIAIPAVARTFFNYLTYSQNRQDALMAIAYQLGGDVFHHFPKATAHAINKEWQAAAQDFRDSIWHNEQTPARAERICKMLEEG